MKKVIRRKFLGLEPLRYKTAMPNTYYYLTHHEVEHLRGLYRNHDSHWFERQRGYYQSRSWKGDGMNVDRAVVLEELEFVITLARVREQVKVCPVDQVVVDMSCSRERAFEILKKMKAEEVTL